MKTIMYIIIMALSCFSYAEIQPPSSKPILQVIQGPQQCVCSKIPCTCSRVFANPQNNDGEDELGVSTEMVASSVLPASKKPVCMCVRAPCNCPSPSSASAEAIADTDEGSFSMDMGDNMTESTPPKLEMRHCPCMMNQSSGKCPCMMKNPRPNCPCMSKDQEMLKDSDEESFNASMEGNKKLVCDDGRMYKLAYPANPPAGCSWESVTPKEMGNQDEFGMGEIISSSVLPKSTQKAGICMCLKPPCNCPQPPAPTKEVEELY